MRDSIPTESADHPNNEEMIIWHRVLKLGAKKGDRWKQSLGRYVEEEYTVLNFTTSGSGSNAEPCAIIERRRTTRSDKGFISQSITRFDYVMGTGITHSVTDMQIGDRPMRTTATTKLLMSRTTKL